MGKFLSYCQSLGIKIETNPPHIPQGNTIAERGFGSIFGTIWKLLLGAPHLPDKPWVEAFQTAIYLHNWTPTNVLGGKAPLEVWEDRPLGNLLHIREWGALAFKHVEQRDRAHKLAPRAVKMHFVGYNTKSKSCLLYTSPSPRD